MPDANLLAQIPLVGIFIVFVIWASREIRQFVNERDKLWRASLDSMQNCVDDLGRQVGLNTAIILLLYRRENGDQDEVVKKLIEDTLQHEHRSR